METVQTTSETNSKEESSTNKIETEVKPQFSKKDKIEKHMQGFKKYQESKSGKPDQEEESNDRSEETDKKDDKPVLDKNKEEAHKKAESEFKFDVEKYKKQGITSEETLKNIEKLEKENFEAQKLIGKHAKTIGDQSSKLKEYESLKLSIQEQRKKLESLKNIDDASIDEAGLESTSKAQKLALQKSQASEKDAELEAEEREVSNKIFMSKYYEDLDTLGDGIAEVMKEDVPEMPSNVLKDYRNNPFSIEGTLLLNMAKRAEYTAKNKTISAENESLKSKIADLEKKLKESPAKVMKRVNEVTQLANTGMSVNSGKSADAKPDYDKYRIFGASKTQLREMIKNIKTGG